MGGERERERESQRERERARKRSVIVNTTTYTLLVVAYCQVDGVEPPAHFIAPSTLISI